MCDAREGKGKVEKTKWRKSPSKRQIMEETRIKGEKNRLSNTQRKIKKIRRAKGGGRWAQEKRD